MTRKHINVENILISILINDEFFMCFIILCPLHFLQKRTPMDFNFLLEIAAMKN